MNRTHTRLLIAATFIAILVSPWHASAQAPSLGTAAPFAVLGGSTVTNTGSSTIFGQLGVSPGSAVVGFPPGTVTGGTIHSNDAVAIQAQSDLGTAYVALAGLPCGTVLTGTDLGTLPPLAPGVYCFATSAQLTGTLTLDAAGVPTSEFIFQIGSTLTTASNAVVNVINGGSACNVYWQVGSSATLGTATAFAGNILALTSITLTTGANASGRLLARNGAVTLDTNSVAVCPICTPITLAPLTLPNGTLLVPYPAQTIIASGGTAPYTYAISAGVLPPGLAISPAGVITGTPTAVGSYTFTVTATDAVGCIGSRVYTIVIGAVGCLPITLTPATIPAVTTGVPYGPVTITAAGGTGPYTFAITAGALPPGLVLSGATATTINISGTPTGAGSFTFTLTATDSLGCLGSQIYSAIVGCPIITVLPATIPNVIMGTPYGPVTFTATGGTAPYIFSVVPGTLPPGLTLTPGGVLSGTPTTAGNYTFTITATDAAGCQGARAFAMAAGVQTGQIPALDPLGLGILMLVLAVAGVFVIKRFTM